MQLWLVLFQDEQSSCSGHCAQGWKHPEGQLPYPTTSGLRQLTTLIKVYKSDQANVQGKSKEHRKAWLRAHHWEGTHSFLGGITKPGWESNMRAVRLKWGQWERPKSCDTVLESFPTLCWKQDVDSKHHPREVLMKTMTVKAAAAFHKQMWNPSCH